MNLRTFSAVLLLLAGVVTLPAAEDPNPPSIRGNSGAWPIRRQWNRAETQHYAKWVEHLYLKKTQGTVEQRTAKLERMLTDPDMNLLEQPDFLGKQSNPQLPRDILRAAHSSLDCSKFTAFIPAYYAYRRALPWMVTHVASGGGDIRTSARNHCAGCSSSFSSASLRGFFVDGVGSFISGNYRVNLTGRKAELSDTVPVAITPEFLLPGCINYVDGHCLILAKVTEYGELCFINASTTITRDVFTYNGMNTVSGITPYGESQTDPWDGCFQGLRVLRYPIALTDKNGHVTGVRRRTNEEMEEFGFSTEQYERSREMTESQHIMVGDIKAQSIHDFIRLRMKSVDTIAPLPFMEQYCVEILDAFRSREEFVQDAWKDVLKNGPITYPEMRQNENIFQALGRWESWSSPSSDVDRRNKYFYLADWCDYAIRMFAVVPDFVDLTGLETYTIRSQEDLAKALIAEKNRIFAGLSMDYTKSNGDKVTLTLLDIEQRLFDFSFDPNHPPELRWGAPAGSEERASAPERYTPVPGGLRISMEQAYEWQTYYRSLCQRETEMSCLRDMFTTGFPVRYKFEQQMNKWMGNTEAVAAAAQEPEPAAPPEPAPEPAVQPEFAPEPAAQAVPEVKPRETEEKTPAGKQERRRRLPWRR